MSLEKVSEMLKKQKRVEGMAHGQSMPRQDIVETLVQRTHLAELHNLMLQLPVGEIGSILDALPTEDAVLLWQQIPAEPSARSAVSTTPQPEPSPAAHPAWPIPSRTPM